MIDTLIGRICIWIAFALPRRVVYWCIVRGGAHATTGKWGHQETPSVTFTEVLTRWPESGEGEMLPPPTPPPFIQDLAQSLGARPEYALIANEIDEVLDRASSAELIALANSLTPSQWEVISAGLRR